MSDNPEEIKRKLEEIEKNYNMFLGLLQQIVDEKGDAAAEDPEYVQMYNDATQLNEQYESLQLKLAEAEAAGPATFEVPQVPEVPVFTPPVPSIPPVLEIPETPSAPVAPVVPIMAPVAPALADAPPAPAMPSGDAPVVQEDPADAMIAGEEGTTIVPPGAGAEAGTQVVVPVEPEKPAEPPPPKYVEVTRTRVEETEIHQQTWSFTGFSSNVTQALGDLAAKGGFITDNILSKQPGKVTLLCPFAADFPLGLMVSQHSKRANAAAGLIHYPHQDLDVKSMPVISQVVQQFLAGAPRGHVLAFLKINKVDPAEEKVSVVVGGITEQDTRMQQALVKGLGNVFFDNDVFYKGQIIDELKSFSSKLGLKLVTVICTSNVIQNYDNFQKFITSF